MKPAHFFFLFVAAILGWAAYDCCGSAKASLADAAVDAGFNQLGIDKQERLEIGSTTKQAFKAAKAGIDVLSGPQQVSAPAPACPCGSDCDCRKPKEAKPEPMVQVCDGGTCRLVPASQAPVYQNCADGSCSSGSCGVRGFRLFGRRR